MLLNSDTKVERHVCCIITNLLEMIELNNRFFELNRLEIFSYY